MTISIIGTRVVTVSPATIRVNVSKSGLVVNHISTETPQPIAPGGGTPGAGAGGVSADDHVHQLPFSTVKSVLEGATESFGVNGQRITNVGDPTQARDAVNLDYLEDYVATHGGGGGGGAVGVVDRNSDGLAPELGEFDTYPRFLVDDGNDEPTWREITAADLAPTFNVVLSGSQSLEVGATVTNPAFVASYTGGPATSAQLTDNDGHAAVILSAPYTNVTSPHAFSKSTNNASTVFTITSNKGAVQDTAQATFTWQPRAFWGASNVVVDTEAEVEALASSGLQSSRARTFTVTAGAGEYIWYAYPASYGDATFTVGGFEGGFTLISSTLSITNAFGVTQNYRLYRSVNPSLGATTVTVS